MEKDFELFVVSVVLAGKLACLVGGDSEPTVGDGDVVDEGAGEGGAAWGESTSTVQEFWLIILSDMI